MNHHALPTTAEPADSVLTQNRAKDSAAFRSLALQQRGAFHMYLGWRRSAAIAGKHAAAFHAHQSARKSIANAIWYWRRSRRT